MKNTRVIEVAGIDEEDRRQHQPEQRRIDQNSVSAVAGLQPVDAAADQEHQPERRQEQHDLAGAL